MGNTTEAIDASRLYDAVVVGGGPAGLTAALYLARARYRVVVVEKDRFGGQIALTSEVVNYPGVLSASGAELGETMRRQAEAFGAEFLLAEVTELDLSGDVKRVRTTRGELSCFAVLLATGASPRRVGFAGEEEFRGHGVAYCATCDGEFFTGKDVFVVGGGFAAAEEAVFLTRYARRVTILVRKGAFSCAQAAVEPLLANDKIDVWYNTEVEEVSGDAVLTEMRYRNNATGETGVYRADAGDTFGVFVFVGYAPATELVRGVAELNPAGYILTDERHRTTADGLFAAGDVCVKELRQVATATGQAASAATQMERWCKAAQERTGLVPERPKANPAASAPAARVSEAATEPASAGEALFDEGMLAQLDAVFSRMAGSLVLRVFSDAGPAAAELRAYMEQLAGLTDKLDVELRDADAAAATGVEQLPCVQVCAADGTPTGLAFHGVPGGHEFTSFVLGLYNAAGPGQPIDDADRFGIASIGRETRIQVLVSLSCTMCPDTVVAAQRIAADNPQVTAEVYDVNRFPGLREEFNVMSVPCVVVDGGRKVAFGKKNLAQMLELVG